MGRGRYSNYIQRINRLERHIHTKSPSTTTPTSLTFWIEGENKPETDNGTVVHVRTITDEEFKRVKEKNKVCM